MLADAPVRPTLAAADAWSALARVPDPEIPVVSAVELGIVRSVEAVDGAVRVRVTPTYSGCPAIAMIDEGIGAALQALGIADFAIETTLAPPWTTDWIAPEARRKLREAGIAPPPLRAGDAAVAVHVRRAGVTGGTAVACPRCGSPRTAEVARFGSTACKAQYRCLDCLEPFDWFKPH